MPPPAPGQGSGASRRTGNDGHRAPRQPGPTPDETGRAARLPLIAYARDRETLAMLTEVLAPVLGPTAEFRPGGIAQARAGLQRLTTPIAALLVDVSGESRPARRARRPRLLRRARRAGLRHRRGPGRGLLPPGGPRPGGAGVSVQAAQPRNHRPQPGALAHRQQPRAARGGRIVTVTGVRGGVGATTVAVNLAAQLADRSRHHILLFDADLHTGTTALMLSATAGGGLRAALENPGRVDVLFAERSSPAISDRLHLLAAEEPLDAPIIAAEGAVPHLTLDSVQPVQFRRRRSAALPDAAEPRAARARPCARAGDGPDPAVAARHAAPSPPAARAETGVAPDRGAQPCRRAGLAVRRSRSSRGSAARWMWSFPGCPSR